MAELGLQLNRVFYEVRNGDIQYDSVEAFSPVSAANSFAVSPLSFQRSTRLAQSARLALAMTSPSRRHLGTPIAGRE